MRAFFVSVMLPALLTSAALAQQSCSPTASASTERHLHAAQAKALAIKAGEMDSGVPAAAVLPLRELKLALSTMADEVVGCAPVALPATQVEKLLNARLRAAAPGLKAKPNGDSSEDTPVAGVFGNDVAASVRLFIGSPDLLAVELSSSVPCGSDSQLLIYGKENEHWTRQLRWSANFETSKEIPNPWGDNFLFDVLRDTTAPNSWHAVVVHGTPWCTSRFSSFGIAVLAPAHNTSGADVIWQTERNYSRGDYGTRLKIIAPDTFEVRLHADEMFFDQDHGYERLVVYRYRLHDGKLSRLQPIAAHARGFVEEWLSMPWSEAVGQSSVDAEDALHTIHLRYENSFPKNSDNFTNWIAGSVRACAGGKRFQVAFDSEGNEIVPGKPGGEQSNRQHHYFQLGTVENGYRMLGVASTPDSSCAGPDLMHKRGQ